MNRTVSIIAVVAVVACVGCIGYYLYETHPQYTVSDMSVVSGIATFTVEADLDRASTITIWAGDEQLSMILDEWTVPAGHYEQTFIVSIPDGMTEAEFDDCLEVHFDGKTGWRR